MMAASARRSGTRSPKSSSLNRGSCASLSVRAAAAARLRAAARRRAAADTAFDDGGVTAFDDFGATCRETRTADFVPLAGLELVVCADTTVLAPATTKVPKM